MVFLFPLFILCEVTQNVSSPKKKHRRKQLLSLSYFKTRKSDKKLNQHQKLQQVARDAAVFTLSQCDYTNDDEDCYGNQFTQGKAVSNTRCQLHTATIDKYSHTCNWKDRKKNVSLRCINYNINNSFAHCTRHNNDA